MATLIYARPYRVFFHQRIWCYLRWPFLLALILMGLQLCRVAWSRWYTAHLFHVAAASISPGAEPLYDDAPATVALLLKSPAYEPARILDIFGRSPAGVRRKNPAWERCIPRGKFFNAGECLLAAGHVTNTKGQKYLVFVTFAGRNPPHSSFALHFLEEPLFFSSERSTGWGYLLEQDRHGNSRDANLPVQFFTGQIVGNDIIIPFVSGADKGRIFFHYDSDWENASPDVEWAP